MSAPRARRSLLSPLGRLSLVAEGGLLRALHMDDPAAPEAAPSAGEPPADRGDEALLDEAVAQLEAWLVGQRRAFDLPLGPQGTPFQLRVWAALQAIPFGETLSYGALARRLGDPLLSRAVGAANGQNPIGILIPCHRVIGADGSLTGYAGGLERKRWLLDFEATATRRQVGLFSR
jgi:methylated-DNA-[protein]-cysteine S-methyltransferase